MDAVALAAGLEQSGLGAWARSSRVAYPAANLVHLLGLIMLVGGIGVLDLRFLGALKRAPAGVLARGLIPLAAGGLLLMIASGFIMFAADAGPLLRSQVFRWKLVLIALALANVGAFHLAWRRQFDHWTAHVPRMAQATAAASLVLWLAAAAAGRLIAYA